VRPAGCRTSSSPSPRPSPLGRGSPRPQHSNDPPIPDSLADGRRFLLPTDLALSVRNKASSPRPSPPEEEREKTRRRFGGSKWEFFRETLSLRERAGVRGNRTRDQ